MMSKINELTTDISALQEEFDALKKELKSKKKELAEEEKKAKVPFGVWASQKWLNTVQAVTSPFVNLHSAAAQKAADPVAYKQMKLGQKGEELASKCQKLDKNKDNTKHAVKCAKMVVKLEDAGLTSGPLVRELRTLVEELRPNKDPKIEQAIANLAEKLDKATEQLQEATCSEQQLVSP
jgi:DNA-binding ferritin-like protein